MCGPISAFSKDMWPHVVKAIACMIDGGTKGTGLPYRLQCKCDQLFLNLYDHNTFNSFWYVLAIRAAEKLSKIIDDLDLLKEVSTALKWQIIEYQKNYGAKKMDITTLGGIRRKVHRPG